MKYLSLLTAVFSALTLVECHTWVEHGMVVGGPSGTNGQKGYIRDYQGRVAGFSPDDRYSYRIYGPEQGVIKANQGKPVQHAGFPKLKASPGSSVQLFWLENGHTTQEAIRKRPGMDPGQVYIYAHPQSAGKNFTFSDIRKWNAQGTNRLIGQFPYDDGKCAEDGPVDNRPTFGKPRIEKYGPKPCMGQFKIPENTPAGPLTVIWLWDYSKQVGNANPKHFEWYSSVMDIDIVAGTGKLPSETDNLVDPRDVHMEAYPTDPTDQKNGVDDMGNDEEFYNASKLRRRGDEDDNDDDDDLFEFVADNIPDDEKPPTGALPDDDDGDDKEDLDDVTDAYPDDDNTTLVKEDYIPETGASPDDDDDVEDEHAEADYYPADDEDEDIEDDGLQRRSVDEDDEPEDDEDDSLQRRSVDDDDEDDDDEEDDGLQKRSADDDDEDDDEDDDDNTGAYPSSESPLPLVQRSAKFRAALRN